MLQCCSGTHKKIHTWHLLQSTKSIYILYILLYNVSISLIVNVFFHFFKIYFCIYFSKKNSLAFVYFSSLLIFILWISGSVRLHKSPLLCLLISFYYCVILYLKARKHLTTIVTSNENGSDGLQWVKEVLGCSLTGWLLKGSHLLTPAHKAQAEPEPIGKCRDWNGCQGSCRWKAH